MRAKNFTERRKRIIAFAGIYGASVILLLLIFSAFGMRITTAGQNVKSTMVNIPAAADAALMHADSLLHAELQDLQQSDFKYRLLADTVSFLEKSKTMTAMADAEASIKKTIDSVQVMTNNYSESEKARYNAMLNTFLLTLTDRQLLKNGQPLLAAGKTSTIGKTTDDIQWKNDLLLKENDISRLQAEIKSLKDKEFMPSTFSGAGEAQKGETELLKTAFNDQQKELDELKGRYNKLKSDNSIVNSQLVEMKKNTAVKPDDTNNASDNKISLLEQKLEMMNADLYFAKIDCNLARTDAQEMISNARQRKELLSESLGMLTSLAKSDDPEIQKKAKEKIIRLNRIATTLHD